MNLAENLVRAAAAHPQRAAVKLDDIEVSFAALQGAAGRVAGWLRTLGVLDQVVEVLVVALYGRLILMVCDIAEVSG